MFLYPTVFLFHAKPKVTICYNYVQFKILVKVCVVQSGLTFGVTDGSLLILTLHLFVWENHL